LNQDLYALPDSPPPIRRTYAIAAPSLPNAVAVKTDASSDICQVGPFMCTPEGRLQKLMLGGAWLSCPAFPAVISEFEALHTIEFEVATFGGDTFTNAAKVGRGRSLAEGVRMCGC
jgi:hypothetical protein